MHKLPITPLTPSAELDNLIDDEEFSDDARYYWVPALFPDSRSSFIPMDPKGVIDYEKVKSDDIQLWLFEAPHRVDTKGLDGITVELQDSQGSFKIGNQSYNITEVPLAWHSSHSLNHTGIYGRSEENDEHLF